jgi:hypothetical protein
MMPVSMMQGAGNRCGDWDDSSVKAYDANGADIAMQRVDVTALFKPYIENQLFGSRPLQRTRQA